MSLIMSLLWWKAEEYLTPSDFSMHMLWGDLFVPCFVSIIFCYSSSQMFKKCSSFSEFLRFHGTVRRVSSHNLHVQSNRNLFSVYFLVTSTRLLTWAMMMRSQSFPLQCRSKRETPSFSNPDPSRTLCWLTNRRTCHPLCPARSVARFACSHIFQMDSIKPRKVLHINYKWGRSDPVSISSIGSSIDIGTQFTDWKILCLRLLVCKVYYSLTWNQQ